MHLFIELFCKDVSLIDRIYCSLYHQHNFRYTVHIGRVFDTIFIAQK